MASEMTIPDDAHIVSLDWLGDVEVVVFMSQKHLEEFEDANKVGFFSPEEDCAGLNGMACTFMREHKPYYCFVFIKPEPRVLVHESVHMAQMILSEKGIPLTLENTETLAYMTDYLFGQLSTIVGETGIPVSGEGGASSA